MKMQHFIFVMAGIFSVVLGAEAKGDEDNGYRSASINLGDEIDSNRDLDPQSLAGSDSENKLLNVSIDQDPNRGTMVTFLFSGIAAYEVLSDSDGTGLTLQFPNSKMKGVLEKLTIGGLGKLRVTGQGKNARFSYNKGEKPSHQIVPDGQKLVVIFPTVVNTNANGIPVPYQHTYRPHKPKPLNTSTGPQVKLSFWRASQHITLNLDGAYLRDVLKLFREASGHPIVYNNWLYERVSIELENVRWEDALRSILRLSGYQLMSQGKIFRVTPLSDIVLDPGSRMCY